MMRIRSIAVGLALLASCAAGEDGVSPRPDATTDVPDEADVASLDAGEAAALDDVVVTLDAFVDASAQEIGVDVALDAQADERTIDVTDAGLDVTTEVAVEATVDAGVDVGADVGADVVSPPDAGPLADSVPTGAVMFFTASSCPTGWVVFGDGAGRVAVPTTGAAEGGSVRGVPLASGEDRTHTHTARASFSLGAVSYVGVVGSGNNGVGGAGDVAATMTTSAASTGLPYVQLLMCRKTGIAQAHPTPLPRGMLMFFAGPMCPTGFSQPAGTQGRLTVGLPDGATNGATFGGAPLGTVSAATHRHAVSARVETSSYGIALASGCCGMGYARSDTYTAMTMTDAVEPAIPTIELLQCQKD